MLAHALIRNLEEELTTSECILSWSSGVVRDLDATTLAHGVVVQIDIRALVEPVVRGLMGRRGEIVMDVRESTKESVPTVYQNTRIIVQRRQ